MSAYQGWWEVPDHLMPATALGELEYPRTADGRQPAAWVEARDWADRKASLPLYDARACPPTAATARQLQAAAARSKRRRACADCGARCQRPLPPLDPEQDRRPLCPACRHVALLRRRQAQLAAARPAIAARAAEVLAWPDGAVVQVDLTVPPPTPAGRRRPATAARVRACDLAGARLLDVLVRLAGPRAQHVPPGAVARQDAAPTVHRALAGRRLILWGPADLDRLRLAAPSEDLPRLPSTPEAGECPATCQPPHPPIGEHVRAVAVEPVATRWRGQLDPHTRTLVACLAPGTPDRLWLLLRRIADTPPTPAGLDHGQTA